MKSGIFQILLGIDFSDSSARALYHAVALTERLGATLHICHIAPASANLSAHTDLGLNVPTEFIDAPQARRRLERMRAMLCPSIDVDLHLRIGEPVTGLLELAAELAPDLLVVGSHGHGAVLRFLLGSVSTQLTHLSPVPVLVVPDPGRAAQASREAEPMGDAGALRPSIVT